MDRREPRIYRSHRPIKTALTVFFVLLAAVVTLIFAVFFGFKKYIVYTSDGVKLVVPWLMDPEDVPSETPGPVTTLPEDTSTEGTSTEDSSTEDTSTEDTSPESTAPENTAPEGSLPENTASGGAGDAS